MDIGVLRAFFKKNIFKYDKFYYKDLNAEFSVKKGNLDWMANKLYTDRLRNRASGFPEQIFFQYFFRFGSIYLGTV